MILRGRLLGQEKPVDVVVENGKAISIEPAGRGKPDAGSRESIIAPTLFDIQVNGARGIDLQSPALKPEDVRAITDILAADGVSHWAPTIITGPLETMAHACRMIAEAMADPVVARAVPGIHIEGPYISPMDGPRGAHAKEFVRNPNLREFDRLYKAADGKILFVTLAPELPGAEKFIKTLVARGIVVALGHHNANAKQIAKAADAGATLCTHLGNGLASNIHRHMNPLWPQLADDRLKAGLIADLEHLPAPVLKTFIRAKRPENIILTSDCVHIAGLPPGHYHLGSMPVELLPTGRICLSGTDLLAGSSLMLLQGIINAVQATDMTLEQAFASATTTPAHQFSLKHKFDLPRTGAKADFLVFAINKTESKWKASIQAVFIDGGRVA